MKKIIVLGGGTAGLVSALILKCRFLTLDVQVIKSDKIGIIGVGEGTTEHLNDFCKFVDIDMFDLIKKADATLKYTLKFENWTKDDYVHYVDQRFDFPLGRYNASYAHVVGNDLKINEFTSPFVYGNQLDLRTLPNQLSFNALKFNDFLIEHCKAKGVKIITDDIVDVNLDDDGNVSSLKSETETYNADFFIDSSGFKRMIMSKLGAKWNSYKEYLPVNEAIAFPTPDTENYDVCITARRMKYGWMWRTPTYGRWGNGYVFDNNYINAEQAQKEVEKYLGEKVNIFKNIKFDPGGLEKVWLKNCVAVGLSASFVEPLEASAIGTTINQCFMLCHYLINYNDYEVNEYNYKCQKILENIRDFICLHYQVNQTDSKFWKNFNKNVKIPDTLKENLKRWKTKLPTEDHFHQNYLLFNAKNFTMILHALGLFDTKSILKEFQTLSPHLQDATRNHVRDHIGKFKLANPMPHKDFLEKFRSNVYKFDKFI